MGSKSGGDTKDGGDPIWWEKIYRLLDKGQDT